MSEPESAARHGGGPEVEDADVKAFQELWLTLARREWSSMVLVPTEAGSATDHVARALAEIGMRMSSVPVTAVTPTRLEYGTAKALADLPAFADGRSLSGGAGWPTVDLDPADVHEVAPGSSKEGEEAAETEVASKALALSPSARLILTVPPVVSEPLGLAATQTADLIVLCVKMGTTSLASVRRTLELIGRERVAGCLLLR
jgi:hypothetical protein